MARTKPRRTWQEKLAQPAERRVVTVPAAQARRMGGHRVLIPRGLDVDELVAGVRKGRLVTIGQIRRSLAERFGAETTCPLCTGIFLRIVAEAAEERRRAGHARITPYWRVVRDDGALIDKFPGGTAAQARALRNEKHSIETGSKPRVAAFAERLAGPKRRGAAGRRTNSGGEHARA